MVWCMFDEDWSCLLHLLFGLVEIRLAFVFLLSCEVVSFDEGKHQLTHSLGLHPLYKLNNN